MALTRGSSSGAGASGQYRPGLTKVQIREMISIEVVTAIRGSIPELFGSIKISMLTLFDDRDATLFEVVVPATTTTVVVAEVRGERSFHYQDFNNIKLPMFNGVQDPIIAMRWLFDVAGCFFTCSYPANQKVKYALNLVRSRAKD